jgi:hypothetical protein
LNLEYQLHQLRQWDAQSDEEKVRWSSGPFSTDTWLRLTDDELSELRDEVIAVLSRWEDREVPDDGLERSPVFFFAHGVPGQP